MKSGKSAKSGKKVMCEFADVASAAQENFLYLRY